MAEEDLGLDEEFQNRRTPAGFGGRNRLSTSTIKTSLPVLKINVPLSLSTHDIFDVFSSVSAKSKFQVIEMEQTIATAVNKEPFSLRKMFLKCLPFAEAKGGAGENLTSNSPISAVRLHITVNDVKGCRKITLKGLYGDGELLKTFITHFRIKLKDLVKTGTKPAKTTQKGGGARMPTCEPDEDSDDGTGLRDGGKYTETSSIYQINKILSTDQYAVGQNVQQYLDSFQIQYKSIPESAALLPQPMEGIMNVVNETV